MTIQCWVSGRSIRRRCGCTGAYLQSGTDAGGSSTCPHGLLPPEAGDHQRSPQRLAATAAQGRASRNPLLTTSGWTAERSHRITRLSMKTLVITTTSAGASGSKRCSWCRSRRPGPAPALAGPRWPPRSGAAGSARRTDQGCGPPAPAPPAGWPGLTPPLGSRARLQPGARRCNARRHWESARRG